MRERKGKQPPGIFSKKAKTARCLRSTSRFQIIGCVKAKDISVKAVNSDCVLTLSLKQRKKYGWMKKKGLILKSQEQLHRTHVNRLLRHLTDNLPEEGVATLLGKHNQVIILSVTLPPDREVEGALHIHTMCLKQGHGGSETKFYSTCQFHAGNSNKKSNPALKDETKKRREVGGGREQEKQT